VATASFESLSTHDETAWIVVAYVLPVVSNRRNR